MIGFELSGIGVWSESFSNWGEFSSGLASGTWKSSGPLQPDLIPPRERRRAPKFVKMAIEVMSQACKMAGMEAEKPATVFCSQMGDMEITDYMCSVLARTPNLISPTRFHNSVNNASVGYWSIATASHAPANAISALELGPVMALLEAATLLATEHTPVLMVVQDGSPPPPLHYICPSGQSFAAALLITPPGASRRPLASCQLAIAQGRAEWPDAGKELPGDLSMNPSATLFSLLAALADSSQELAELTFPISAEISLKLDVQRSEGQGG